MKSIISGECESPVCVHVADGAQWSASSTSTTAPAAAAGNLSLHLPYFLASRQRQLITVAALTAALLFIYDGLQVSFLLAAKLPSTAELNKIICTAPYS